MTDFKKPDLNAAKEISVMNLFKTKKKKVIQIIYISI